MGRVVLVLLLACSPSTLQSSATIEEAELSDTETRLGTSEDDARALCDLGLLGEVIECRFRSETQSLPHGFQADLLEAQLAGEETRVLHLVIRSPDDLEATTTVELADAYDAPGESVSYEVGSLAVTSDGNLEVSTIHVVQTSPGPDGVTTRSTGLVHCNPNGESWVCVVAARDADLVQP